jgi:hypothetical protein
MKIHFGLALILLGGMTLPAMAGDVKGESTDKKHSTKSIGTTSGGGGAGATQSKQKQKMLNPQPEPPGRR